MKYSTMKQQVEDALKQFKPGVPSFDYPFFIADLFTAVNNQEKINIQPYDSDLRSFTDTLFDFDYTPLTASGTEEITLIFQNYDSFTFVLSRAEITQPGPAKYYVNHSNSGQQINMRFHI